MAAIKAGKDFNLSTIMQEYGSIYLDNQRFNNLENFVEQITQVDGVDTEKLAQFLSFDQSNPKGLDPIVARELASIMGDIINEVVGLRIDSKKRVSTTGMLIMEFSTYLDPS